MNNRTVKYYAVVPAAGSGQRFGGEMPKQYVSVLGKPVLRHTLELLHGIDWIDVIVLVHAADDELVNQQLLADLQRVKTCVGGKTRSESVRLGLEYLGADDEDWVLVHDAVRPCVSVDNINALRQSLEDRSNNKADAGILALPVRDTLKRVRNDLITETPARTNLWQAQTPQQARIGQLKHALASHADKQEITDEASALEAAGVAVRVVAGRADNIKITYPEDLELAAAILSRQNR